LLLDIVALASSEGTLGFFFSEAMNVLRGRVVPLAAAALRSKPSVLPLGARLTNGGASEQRAAVHPAAARSTSAGGEAMDCDDDGRE